ncbi:SUMF1/EgtB/PvdO family nonheme iron enzyme [Streptomyces sp. NPDC001816]|uniref:SUMF1/EgtB/PvdO family nonheme iron enzyme n=1 Tax=Streptomyces sp. NPDC001816 TaxID=3364612 RepID=UPI0036C4F4A0
MERTTPVSRYQSGVSPYGVFDLCGNTWEWCGTETEPGRHELKGSAFTSPFTRAAPTPPCPTTTPVSAASARARGTSAPLSPHRVAASPQCPPHSPASCGLE